MDTYLVINRRSDFAGGLLVNLRSEGEGLTLRDAEGIARGCAYLPRLDSGRRDFAWTRLTLDLDAFEGMVRVAAFAADNDVLPEAGMPVEDYLRDPFVAPNVKASTVDPLYTAGFVDGRDVLLGLRGRYLYLKIEIVLTGGPPPVLRAVRARLAGDHMLDYLPAVYARSDKDGFLFRFLSVFDAMVKDLEARIDHFEENLDFDKQSGERLQYLAGWVGVHEPEADDEALRDINRKIVQLGDELGKPVVATGDVHFLDPHNAINRSIIQAGMGYDDADMQPPLYFKTTNEMLEEFAYLGAEKCHEVVIDNPRKIADQVDKLQLFPKHPKGEDTFQPFWEDAADNIQNMTWGTAKELYGDELPEIVVNRLNKELKSIIGYGFATLYNIAQRLVSKSNADGYLVGSRGSVGSSLVARMCGITEVNALPPHYRCTHCRKGFFDVDKSQYKVGVDLPDKDCPICGQKLVKDGFDIPFEVFLGFEGDKVPDIDLNFSGEYQNRAFHNVEELFGHDHVFRAGTITGLAEKTAYGYVSKYFEERGLQVGNTEKERLAAGCEGVKKTTGQHPGGMVVVPKEYEIYQFTAVQHPADDLNSDFTTTHFDFNSMHDILVKLDCLGHDDPTVLHMLEELTGIGYKDVPLDDPDVRSLFSSPKALGVTPEDIGCLTGTFGVPEFGTSFVRGMLDETKPTTMEELLRISGLSHGTDVWLGNAQELIANGTAKLSECVCCRDDIMNYLIDKGVAPKMAFTTMESVRKGRGLKPEMEQAMIEQHVPQWFMDSCKKIKYMFPKGHAVAYVTMALRVAWYKVHRPLAYYCAYFTVRGDGFDAMTMLIDPATIREKIKQIKADPKASAKDKEAVTSLELVLEMNMRGFKFLPCDLYKSDLKKFKMEGETGLRCPFTSLGGLGESAAINIVRERERGPFMSVEDLKERTRISSAVIELLRTHGSLEGLSETSQVCMF